MTLENFLFFVTFAQGIVVLATYVVIRCDVEWALNFFDTVAKREIVTFGSVILLGGFLTGAITLLSWWAWK